MKRSLLLLLLIVAASAGGCRPKGSDKPARLDAALTPGHFIVRHPNFEGHLDSKVEREGSKYTMKLDYSGFPDKSAITLESKTFPLVRTGGEIPTTFDLSSSVGDASIAALTGGTPIAVKIPFEMTFFDKRQKVSGAFTSVNVSQPLRACMTTPPCTFATDGPANAKPNILVVTKGDEITQKVYGSPTKVRDIDWVAFVVGADAVPGKKCKMQQLSGVMAGTSDEHILMREAERITVRDRRTGALLHTRSLLADDRCPLYADIKLTGTETGLRGTLTDRDRDRLYMELRGDAPPSAPSASSTTTNTTPAPTSTTKSKTTPTKKK